MRIRDLLAGALFANAVPHTILGLAGKRCMTPLGGVSSSPAANLVWAGCNLAAATAALAPSGWRDTSQGDAEERLQAVIFGVSGAATFAAIYEFTPTAARHRRVRAGAEAPTS